MKKMLCLVALSLAATASADEGRFPIFGPVEILAPGHYVLTRDIVAGSGIVIRVDDVVLDLNGMTIEITNPLAAGVTVQSSTLGLDRGVTIRNGRIVGGVSGIYVTPPGGGHVRIEDVGIDGSASHGIRIHTVDSFEVHDCRIRNAGGAGIYVASPSGVTGVASGNLIDGTVDAGFAAFAVEGARITGNVVLNTGTAGISMTGTNNRVTDNVLRRTGGGSSTTDGIFASGTGNLFQGNVVTDTTKDGIGVLSDSAGSVVRQNLSAGHGRYGILIAAPNVTVELNLAGANGAYGLHGGASPTLGPTVYRDNMLRGNAGGSAEEFNPGGLDDRGGNICAPACP